MSDLLGAVLSLAFLVQVATKAIPYVLAALGGTLAERSGVVDLALESKLLAGAFAAATVGHATDSMAAALIAGALAGAAVGALHAAIALITRADQVVTGVALNLAAAGMTRYLLQVLYGQGANSLPAPQLGGLAEDMTAWIALGAAIAVPLVVVRTTFGLRLRAAGDRPLALRAAGHSVAWTRVGAMMLGGTLAGIGGAQLSLAVGGFSADMSSGRGYIALAAVILAGWRPGRAVLACLVFALADALTDQLQMNVVALPRELTGLFPYALPLAILALAPSRMQPPAALGKPES
ncbi:MAG: ABC transporter permease [Deltaproteobacteria bacterium]|nr:ABC transporter permease [Deltaproteobacteria bacterium]